MTKRIKWKTKTKPDGIEEAKNEESWKKIKSLDRATRKWYKTLKIILDRVKQFNMQRNEDEKNRKKTRYKEKHKKNQKHEMKRRKT